MTSIQPFDPGRFQFVKTARFADVVERCGKPELHLVLSEPGKDRTLRSAIKQERVMTVFQQAVGQKADRGTIGFEPGSSRQYLIFPKALRPFAGAKIVAIKHELWESKMVPHSKRTERSRRPKPERRPPKLPAEKPLSAKVVAFKPADNSEDEDEDSGIKTEVRRAMNLLEEGKTVAAFNVLKRIVDA